MKLSLWGNVKLVFSMVTSMKEENLDQLHEQNVVKVEGEITLTLWNGEKVVITAEELMELRPDLATIEDVEDEK